jgi:hypothetical protein
MQISCHPHKLKCAIEQALAEFFRSEGGALDAFYGDVSLIIIAKDSSAADLMGRKFVRVKAEDVLLISLTDLAHELAGVM